ncbi:MAG: AAA family ATPase [Deltaproteobacteria bacterium]|nr:AAA family ATPase [Deltaproteobacteria bacterium]
MTLPPLINALLDPAVYSEPATKVILRQTHISYLFFTPRFVYKVKKPVNLGFLDFSTLAKRRHYCEEELRLNRRCAPEVYLEVVGIGFEKGRAIIGAKRPVEYAVKMRRLKPGACLDNAIQGNTVTTAMIKKTGNAIAAFHESAATGKHISKFGSSRVIRRNVEENFSQTMPFIGRCITARNWRNIKSYTNGFLLNNKTLLASRVRDGFIRDCHGDIHAEHVSFGKGRLSIIDCIEFNERFRFADTISDLAFLSMDLDYLNRHDLSKILEAAYLEKTGDENGGRLLDFYKCYRAYVRGKVSAFKSKEPEVDTDERRNAWIDAKVHFNLSGLYASGGFRPKAVLVRGLSGTGKTTLAESLASAVNFERISSDEVRKGLAKIPALKAVKAGFGKGIYSERWTEKTYDAMIEKAGEYLKQGRSVVLDATFARLAFIEAAKEACKGASFHVIECAADDETVKKHILKRTSEPSSSDADWRIYQRQKESFEQTTMPCVVIPANRPLHNNLKTTIGKIFD